MRIWQRLWRGFVIGSEAVGNAISRWVMTPLLYLFLGTFFSLPTRASDPLRVKRPASSWQSRPARGAETVETARRPF